MEIRQFSPDLLREVYINMLPEDFPPAEIKPFKIVAPLIANKHYLGYGYYEQDEMRAYAMFLHADQGRYLLLDYFAVRYAYRGGGYGSRFLSQLTESCPGYDGLLGEIENPAFAADENEASIRSRRLAFYERCGWRLTDVRCRLIGVEYSVIALDYQGSAAGDDLRGELERLYRLMFKPANYRRNILIHPGD